MGFFIVSVLCRLFCSWSFIYFQRLVSSDVYGNALGVFWNTWSGSAWCCWFVRAVLLQPPMFGFKDEFFTSHFHHPSNVPSNMPAFCCDLKQGFALCIDVTKQRQKKNSRLRWNCHNFSKSNQHLQFIPDIENYQHLPFHRCIHKVKHYSQTHSFFRTCLLFCSILGIEYLLQMPFQNILLQPFTVNRWHLQALLTIKCSSFAENLNLLIIFWHDMWFA